MKVLGFGAVAQVGKDTAAEYLQKNLPNTRRVAFADKLKQCAMDLFGLTYEQCHGSKEIKEAVDPRFGKSPRQMMQELGEKMREIYPNVWIDFVFNDTIPALQEQGIENFVISDIRYPNEADRVHHFGGAVCRIDRAAGGTSVGANHSSETSMNDYKDFDFIINNNGSMEDFLFSVLKVAEDIYGRTETRY